MNSQKIWGAILIALSLIGLIYCCMHTFDSHYRKNPLGGIIILAAFFLLTGMAMVKNALESSDS